MISWWWLIPAAVVGGGLGILALAICTAGSSADDWAEGYWAGRLWKDSVKYHNEHKDDEVDDGVS